ncbi:MAG: hypothetical protein U0350_02580 [Caldilineaceae bacterium]
MESYAKGTWLWIGSVITAMLVLIGIIEDRVPASSLSTWLMLGVVLLGYTGIFAWLYYHRKPATPPTQPRTLRFVGRQSELIIHEPASLQEKVGSYLAIQRGIDESLN